MTKTEKNKLNVRETMGLNLKSLRQKAGLSRAELSEVLQISVQQLQKYESGKNRIPADGLFILKNFFDVDYDVFFANIDLDGDKDRKASVVRDPIAQDVYEIVSAIPDRSMKLKIRQIAKILSPAMVMG